MELYNFFTELVPETEAHKVQRLKNANTAINIDFKSCGESRIIEYKSTRYNKLKESSEEIIYYSIVGQVLGEDTSSGDLDLMIILDDIEYTWFDAFLPSINNIEE